MLSSHRTKHIPSCYVEEELLVWIEEYLTCRNADQFTQKDITFENYNVTVTGSAGAHECESVRDMTFSCLPSDTRSVRLYYNVHLSSGVDFVTIVLFSRSVTESHISVSWSGPQGKEVVARITETILGRIGLYLNKSWLRRFDAQFYMSLLGGICMLLGLLLSNRHDGLIIVVMMGLVIVVLLLHRLPHCYFRTLTNDVIVRRTRKLLAVWFVVFVISLVVGIFSGA